MKKIKIKYFPEPTKDNQYVQNTIKVIEQAVGVNVEIINSLKTAIKQPRLVFSKRKCDILIINWLENHMRSSSNKISVLGIFKYFSYLLYFRLMAKKIIYVRHNVYPHNMVGFHAKLATIITDVGEKMCHIKIAHSGHLISKGYAYIPHPLYNLKLDIQYKPKFNNYYIMFGRIERYKKIENIIKNWDLEETLLVAGSIGDESYLHELTSMAQGKNIKFDARFIPDNEAANLVSASNGIILAHSEENMIVSGSFFFAITLGVPVFAIENPFLNWLKNELIFKELYLTNSPEKIVASLKKSQPFDRNVIKKQANDFFGPITTEKSWQSLINDSPNPKN